MVLMYKQISPSKDEDIFIRLGRTAGLLFSLAVATQLVFFLCNQCL
jgi:hypothetical protein